jgi:hypothetical protein
VRYGLKLFVPVIKYTAKTGNCFSTGIFNFDTGFLLVAETAQSSIPDTGKVLLLSSSSGPVVGSYPMSTGCPFSGDKEGKT